MDLDLLPWLGLSAKSWGEALDGSALKWTEELKVQADRISESISDHF